MRVAMVSVICLLVADVAAAEPVTGREAKRMVFAPGKAEVEMLPVDFLSEKETGILKMVVAGQPYYGAIAVSPDEGLASEATVAAANHHTIEAASAAAIAACEAKRQGDRKCEIVGLIRPEGWEKRGLSLSSDATKGLREDYGARGPRALAISPATGRWGLGKGEAATEAALAECAKSGSAKDCSLAVAD